MPGISEKRNTLPLKLISWNVNGLRAVMKKDFEASLHKLDADIVAIQETKLQEHQLTPGMTNLADYTSYWSHAKTKKGYSGVGVYTRQAPETVRYGMGEPRFDDEGRIAIDGFYDDVLDWDE